ncbi:MAG TPA: C40 family peptidase [Burkholderiaceae bacterium]|nr:C40 family peptidase [Burkholderiaceae bacterium]
MCAVTAVVLASTLAHAAPDEDDPLGRLLAERGLVGEGGGRASERAAAPSSRAPVRRVAMAAQPSAPNKAQALVRQTRDRAAALIAAARGLMGVPYVHGGSSADEGFDCSGFTRHVFQHTLGLALPRSSREQASAPGLMPVSRNDLRPGDLVFFNTVSSAFSHVGIYLGNNKFIHAPRTGGQIRIEDLSVGYWTQRFDGARRAISITEGTASTNPATAAVSTTNTMGLPAPQR